MVVHLISSIPCIFVLLDRHQSIFHCFVDQCVDTGYEEVDGAKQSLAILTQQLLCFCIIPKLILQRNTEVLPANVMTCHMGRFCNTIPATLGTSGWGQWRHLLEPAASAQFFESDRWDRWPVLGCFHTCSSCLLTRQSEPQVPGLLSVSLGQTFLRTSALYTAQWIWTEISTQCQRNLM